MAGLASKLRPLARTLHAIRASLLASAIAGTLRCSRFLAASIQGFSPCRSQAAAERAHLLIEQAEALGEPPEDPLLLFSALYGLWVVHYVAFNGDVMRKLAAQFLALAQKHAATAPRMIGHRLVGMSLLHTGDIAEGRAHFALANALYDPVEQHRRTGDALWCKTLGRRIHWKSLSLWLLGYPEAALAMQTTR